MIGKYNLYRHSIYLEYGIYIFFPTSFSVLLNLLKVSLVCGIFLTYHRIWDRHRWGVLGVQLPRATNIIKAPEPWKGLTSGYHCVAAANNIICDGHAMVAMAHPHTF